MVYKKILKIILLILFLSAPITPLLAECVWKTEQKQTDYPGNITGGCTNVDGFVNSAHSRCDPSTKPETHYSPGLHKTVQCCCTVASIAETESIIGGSVWANPFDNLKIKIPGLKSFSNPKCVETDEGEVCYVPWMGEYIQGLYNYGMGIGSILAIVVIAVGGVIWLTSAGSVSKIDSAKSWISGGIIGIILLLGIYTFMSLISDKLVNLPSLEVEIVQVTEKCDKKLSDAGACVACDNCTRLNVPVKSGMGNSVNIKLADKLFDAYQIIGNWEVTEAWPPTVIHSNLCHANGTCVDVGLKGNDSPENVKKIYDALVAQGLNVVFETNKSCADYSVRCEDTTNPKYEHITGPHFSVYKQ